METKIRLKTAVLLLLLAFLAACENTKQKVENDTPKMVNKLPDEIKPWLPPKVSVLDLVSNESQYQGKTVEIHGYMSWNNTGDREFYLSDSQYKDKPHVVVPYGTCSNLREILTQDPPWDKYIPVKVVGIFESYRYKITDPKVSF